MGLITRRGLLAAGGTLAAALTPGKPYADELGDLVRALKPTNPPLAAPDITFLSADGAAHHLSDFIGHGMVVNLWATWCAPCVEEMPSLSKLSKALAPQDIAVLPLSSDRGGAQAVQAFFQEHAITGLPVLLDPRSAAAHALGARGIPTSVLVDHKGREVARLEGSADWSTPAAVQLVRKLVSD
jgi:thiol-disulfide isomerase/thioredoxin